MKIAFFCDSLSTAPAEFIPLASFLSESGADTVLFFEKMQENVAHALEPSGRPFYVRERRYQRPSEWAPSPPRTRPRTDTETGIARAKKWHGHRHGMRSAAGGLRQYLRFRHTYRAILAREGVSLVLTYTDRSLNLGPSLFMACRDRHIPLVRLQVTRTIQSRLLYPRLSDPLFRTDSCRNKLLAALYPGSVLRTNSTAFLYYHFYKALPFLLTGSAPRNPWHNGDSWCDCHFLISRKHLEDERREGAAIPRFAITGQFSHDQMYRNTQRRTDTRNRLMQKYFACPPASSELIILALPQLYEHNVMDRHTARSEIVALLKSLSAFTGKFVLASLHPKMSYDEYAPLAEPLPRVAIAREERLSEIIAAGDYFLSFFESTIPWAMMCNVVPVFLDYYRLGFDLSGYRSCQVLTKKSALESDMSRVFATRKTILNTIPEDRDLLPPFDGRTGDRIRRAAQLVVDLGPELSKRQGALEL